MTLNIRISQKELCFARFEAQPSAAFTFEKRAVRPQVPLTVNVREAMAQLPLLREHYTHVNVFSGGPVTIVPLSEFEEDDVTALYNYVTAPTEPSRIFYDTVPSANVVVLSALSEATCRALEESFGEIRYSSIQTPLLQHFAERTEPAAPGGRRAYLYVHDKDLDFCVLEGKRLLAQTRFKINALTDADYYTLTAARHMGLALDETPFYVCGAAHQSAPLCQSLGKYVANVNHLRPEEEWAGQVVARDERVPYDLVCALLKST